MIEERYTFIRGLLKAEELDAILFFGLPNIRYLSGFTGTDGVLLCRDEDFIFLTDSRYVVQAQQQVIGGQVVCYKNKLKSVVDELLARGCRRIGFDAATVSVAHYNELSGIASSSIDLIPLDIQLHSLRGIKSEGELISLKSAANLNHRAFEIVEPLICPGITEREVALELEFALKRLGGEVNAFDFIVASGSRGAQPHGVATNKKIVAGELVTIDFGTRVDGYHSDETVTFAIGEVDRKLRQIFDIVLEAHDSALAAICVGMPICDLDAVARDYISSAGYGSYFGHGLGHGVGLEVHEYPSVASRVKDVLKAGMVITIEPGVYVPGIGGVRIEDTVVVTGDGYYALTTIPKKFKQLSI